MSSTAAAEARNQRRENNILYIDTTKLKRTVLLRITGPSELHD